MLLNDVSSSSFSDSFSVEVQEMLRSARLRMKEDSGAIKDVRLLLALEKRYDSNQRQWQLAEIQLHWLLASDSTQCHCAALEHRRGGGASGIACSALCLKGEHAYAQDIPQADSLAKHVFYAWSKCLFQSKARSFECELEEIRGSKRVSNLFDVAGDKLAIQVSFGAWARLVHLAAMRRQLRRSPTKAKTQTTFNFDDDDAQASVPSLADQLFEEVGFHGFAMRIKAQQMHLAKVQAKLGAKKVRSDSFGHVASTVVSSRRASSSFVRSTVAFNDPPSTLDEPRRASVGSPALPQGPRGRRGLAGAAPRPMRRRGSDASSENSQRLVEGETPRSQLPPLFGSAVPEGFAAVQTETQAVSTAFWTCALLDAGANVAAAPAAAPISERTPPNASPYAASTGASWAATTGAYCGASAVAYASASGGASWLTDGASWQTDGALRGASDPWPPPARSGDGFDETYLAPALGAGPPRPLASSPRGRRKASGAHASAPSPASPAVAVAAPHAVAVQTPRAVLTLLAPSPPKTRRQPQTSPKPSRGIKPWSKPVVADAVVRAEFGCDSKRLESRVFEFEQSRRSRRLESEFE
mmetsp:Transcript_20474/g.72883  ORF Transcript_20474/g.72883 Transcript_20474/m.72883 type:complete len:584 (-) Transcript_20474:49-1800(-)